MKNTHLFAELPGGISLPVTDRSDEFFSPVETYFAQSVDETLAIIREIPCIKVLVVNQALEVVFSAFRSRFPDGVTILLTDVSMDSYADLLMHREDELVDHVVAYNGASSWIYDDLMITLRKLNGGPIFGAHQYLSPGTKFSVKKISGSQSRDPLNRQVYEFAETVKLGQYLAKAAASICEELLTNAIYDAPTNSEGNRLYADKDRSQPVSLGSAQRAELSYGCDGRFFAIAVSDPFGSLKRAKFQSYIKKAVRRHEGLSIIDTKKGGAGLGLFKILRAAHALICNSRPGKHTEMIAIIDLSHQVRDFSKVSRSLHFFEDSLLADLP